MESQSELQMTRNDPRIHFNNPEPTEQISIHGPLNNSYVSYRKNIEGTVSNSRAKVWVLVHPLNTSTYKVQQEINVSNDGKWNVLAYFGREGQDSGVEFEIIAIANPNIALNEGEILNRWPEAQWYSNVIKVKRQ